MRTVPTQVDAVRRGMPNGNDPQAGATPVTIPGYDAPVAASDKIVADVEL